MKKISLVLLATLILFYSVAFPIHNKAYADTVTGTVPANLNTTSLNGASAYAVAATLSAYMSGQKMWNSIADNTGLAATSRAIYNAASPTAKTALQTAISDAWAAGKTTVALPKEFYNYLTNVLPTAALLDANYGKWDGQVLDNQYALMATTSTNASVTFQNGYQLLMIAPDGHIASISQYGFSLYYENGVGWRDNYGGGEHTYSSSLGSPDLSSLAGVIAFMASYWQGYTFQWATIVDGQYKYAGADVTQSLQGIMHWSPDINTPSIDVPMPTDVNYPTANLDGTSLRWDGTTGDWVLPDGSLADIAHSVTGYPDLSIATDGTIAWTDTATGTTTAVSDTTTGTTTGDTTTDTTAPSPTGGWGNFLPVSLLLALLDLLRAILMYLARMFEFIMTLPVIPAIPIDNAAFDWFRNAAIMGVHIYDIVVSLATIGFSFLVFKAVRKVLGNA